MSEDIEQFTRRWVGKQFFRREIQELLGWAVRFGYNCCEKGNTEDQTIEHFKEFLQQKYYFKKKCG